MKMKFTLFLAFDNVALWVLILGYRNTLDNFVKWIRADAMISLIIAIIFLAIIAISGHTTNKINFVLIIILIASLAFLIWWNSSLDYISDVLKAIFKT